MMEMKRIKKGQKNDQPWCEGCLHIPGEGIECFLYMVFCMRGALILLRWRDQTLLYILKNLLIFSDYSHGFPTHCEVSMNLVLFLSCFSCPLISYLKGTWMKVLTDISQFSVGSQQWWVLSEREGYWVFWLTRMKFLVNWCNFLRSYFTFQHKKNIANRWNTAGNSRIDIYGYISIFWGTKTLQSL